jgi:nucleoside-diphosphate kinase
MASERTLSIIKPDATERNITGLIVARLEAAGLRVIAQKRVWWTKKDAKKFYEVHKDQPFYKDLVAFMTSGPIVLQVLEGEDAIARRWARPIRSMPRPAPSARISASICSGTRCTALTAPRRPSARSRSASRRPRSSVSDHIGDGVLLKNPS